MDGDQLTLEQALALLSLPRGDRHASGDQGEPIEAGIGRFGPYVKMGAVFGSLDRDDDVLAVGLNRAVDLLAKKLASVRSLGPHPKDAAPVSVRKGRFGPYAQHGNMVANLPRGVLMEDVSLDEAVALLAEKGKALKPRGAAGKKAAGRKGAAKPAAGKEAGVPASAPRAAARKAGTPKPAGAPAKGVRKPAAKRKAATGRPKAAE